MLLPYKVATLLYCFDDQDRVLLMERAQEPNLGLWSPCGGKLDTTTGESPYACACREAYEELGIRVQVRDFHLAGLISEHGYQGETHWLLFLFELKQRLRELPPPHREGRFQFFKRDSIHDLNIPETDRKSIWPWFWQYRGGFFSAHCHCNPDGTYRWELEEAQTGR